MRALDVRLDRLEEQLSVRQRVQAVAVILDIEGCPAWAERLPAGRCVRVVTPDEAIRRRTLTALRKGREPEATVVLDFKPGASEFIRRVVTAGEPPEQACTGARGDRKTSAALAAILVHADLHLAAGGDLPVRWMVPTDTHANHELKLVRTMGAPWTGGVWLLRDDRHLGVATVAGVELAHLDLFGVRDLGAHDRLRAECSGLWAEEVAPAALEGDGGVSLDAWSLALTSIRLATCRPVAMLTSNMPDEDHWLWRRFVTRRHPGTAMTRIPAGESASAEDRARWEQALEGRPDLLARLLRGEPGAIQQGEAVTPTFTDQHIAPERLRPVQGVGLTLGHDAGHTPTSIVGTVYAGSILIYAALSSTRAGTRQHVETLVRPWLAANAPWCLDAPSTRLAHRYDPSMDTGEQADIDQDPVRVLRELLGGPVKAGAVSWPGRIEPVLRLLRDFNPTTGRPTLQIDPHDGYPLIQALRGRWHFPTVHGVVSRDLPVKNHPWSDLGDSFCYLVGGIRPSRVLDEERDRRPRQAFAKSSLDHDRPAPTRAWR